MRSKNFVCPLCKREIKPEERFIVVPPMRMHQECYDKDVGVT